MAEIYIKATCTCQRRASRSGNFIPEKEVLINIVKELGGIQSRSGSFREETNHTLLPGIDP
jgi:hypothetical protein